MTDYMTLTAPNGGETFKIGDTITVKWKNCNHPDDMKINIWLNDSRVPQRDIEIASKIPLSQGSYSFTIPPTITTNGATFKLGGVNAYTIFINNGLVGGGPANVSVSNKPFTINAE
jgi:hypothetical protein